MSIAVLNTIRNDIADDCDDKASSIELFDMLGHKQKPLILNQSLDKFESMFSIIGCNELLAMDENGSYSMIVFKLIT
jgi:hypothetical protein